MNERIRELAIEAGYTTDMFGIGHWDMPECKKFAELIVRECIVQCEKNKDHEWLGSGSKLSAFNIKEHFGVKE
jgi:CTP:phosphocholine cytidylyltransferase-like protein